MIEKSKNGKPRAIPMSQRVRRILKMLSEGATIEYVISIRTKSRIDDVKKEMEVLKNPPTKSCNKRYAYLIIIAGKWEHTQEAN